MTAPVVSRPNPLLRLVHFYHDVMAEMRKVTWPDIPQLRDATTKIVIFVLLIGAVIALMDVILQQLLVKLIPSLFSGS
jgi:preprotein translocase subunit SecE